MRNIDTQLTQLLSRYPEIKLALLFGSQASGTASFDSDIDLALLTDHEMESEFKLQLIESIAKEFGCPVDIIDLNYAAEPVLGQALKGKKLLGSNSAYANLLTRHVTNVADFVPLQQRILKERRDAWIS